jgi:hypothetical protein
VAQVFAQESLSMNAGDEAIEELYRDLLKVDPE